MGDYFYAEQRVGGYEDPYAAQRLAYEQQLYRQQCYPQQCYQRQVYCPPPPIVPSRNHVALSYSTAGSFVSPTQSPKSVFLTSVTTIPVGGLTIAAGGTLASPFIFSGDFPHPLVSGEAAVAIANISPGVTASLTATANITGTFGSLVTIIVTLSNSTGAALTIPAGQAAVSVVVGYL
jgi:hypothetical protein